MKGVEEKNGSAGGTTLQAQEHDKSKHQKASVLEGGGAAKAKIEEAIKVG